MMMLSDIANALNARMLGSDVRVASVGTDSRKITKEQLFVALRGERFDGHLYAKESIQQGAAAALISDETLDVRPAVLVEDTRLGLGSLAHYWRKKFTMPLVAVTGSNGKTTVKEMIAAILKAAGGEVLATHGNLNNDIGMPLTLLRLEEQHTHAVIEMGMNHLGEISYLTKLAAPDVALVNNAGTAHIGELGSREAIAEAKGEIFEGLSAAGIAVINANDRFADYWHALNHGKHCITFGIDVDADVSLLVQEGQLIEIKLPSGVARVQLHALGWHNICNALAASAVAVALNVPVEAIAKGLSAFSGVKGRLQLMNSNRGYQLIDDTYNANPDSMNMAIDVLASIKSAGQKKAVFVMGDMAELGDEAKTLHAEVGHYAKQCGVDQLMTLGPLSKEANRAFGDSAEHFESKKALIEAINASVKADSCLLVKGSRSMKMEEIVSALVDEERIEEMQ